MQNIERIYINEIIRVTYKCNWRCKFCNVSKTNNFGKHDISSRQVIFQILSLVKKYTAQEREYMILSFSGGEPTLSKNLGKYIQLAKKIGIGNIQIQTNGIRLFQEKDYIFHLINSGADDIFLAHHSHDDFINKKLGSYTNIQEFTDWVKYIYENNIHTLISINLNIVITKMNLFGLYDYIEFLIISNFVRLITPDANDGERNTYKISFGFVQPHGYAFLNQDDILLDYSIEQIRCIQDVLALCYKNNIYPDFHFTSPPLCIIHEPILNLEYIKLRKLENDTSSRKINIGNLESYKILWKEKEKLPECSGCQYNTYCLGFYKNWIEFVGREYATNKILYFLQNDTPSVYPKNSGEG